MNKKTLLKNQGRFDLIRRVNNLIGVDEAGRGAWAGPLVVGVARLKNRDCRFLHLLKDSKKLSMHQREVLYELIVKDFDIATGWATPESIDADGLAKASVNAVLAAVEKLARDSDEVIIDGNVNYLKGSVFAGCTTTLIKGDSKVIEIMAAAIVAKVERDRYMKQISEEFSGYGFEKHVGYGTKVHKQALELLGVTILHRRSYKPVAALL